jgi:hypothetical protein
MPSITVKSSAFLMIKPAFFAAAISILAAFGFGAAFGFAVLGFAVAFGFAGALGITAATGAATTGATTFGGSGALITGGATVAAGISTAFACVVLPTLGVDLQQHLHNHLLRSQPSKVPAINHQKQQPNELKSELILTPQ